ncbi:MAG: helix-turn-helix domain-containing protein [Myxococcota bacterium]
MANLNPFSADIVDYVRNHMTDEAILELIVNKLTGDDGEAPVEAAPKTRAKRGPAKKKVVARKASPAPRKTTAKKKAVAKKKAPTRRRARSGDREAERAKVEQVITSSKGLSASEIAAKAKMPKERVSQHVKKLKEAGAIYQGGDRRFARYAGTKKIAEAASEYAKKNAKGPRRR